MGKTTDRKKVPPLREGDKLTRNEFHRRYKASKTVNRAELIYGIVHIISAHGKHNMSPVSYYHGDPHAVIIQWLANYVMLTPGTKSTAPITVKAREATSMPEPDASLRILTEAGGQSRFERHGYFDSGAELFVEISHTSVAHDLGRKRDLFFEEGVKEYIVWDTDAAAIHWHVAGDHGYEVLAADTDGILKSRVFPGLWMDEAALLKHDAAGLNQTLVSGASSPEHSEFVARLQKAMTGK